MKKAQLQPIISNLKNMLNEMEHADLSENSVLTNPTHSPAWVLGKCVAIARQSINLLEGKPALAHLYEKSKRIDNG